MPETPAAITVAGQSYRVTSDAPAHELHRLARLLDARVSACNARGRLTPTQALIYAGLTLVEDLETAQSRRQRLETTCRSSLEALLLRIDAALEAVNLLLPLAESPTQPNHPT